MRLIRLHRLALLFTVALVIGLFFNVLEQPASCQETTGGLQGTVQDSTGAVVPGADVTVTAPTLVGAKETKTDGAGYYRFTNLPPDTYTITVKAAGFEGYKHTNLLIEVGHLPTLNVPLKVGSVNAVVQVSSEGPMIDTTTTTTLTNIPENVIQNIPHGTSFQSVIQFAPSARNEPLMGNTTTSNGSGGASPGSGSNGNSVGYSIGGGADSENSYLVEGQETANIIGGFSHTQVPMDFIKEVQLKTSGVQAEYGGALGGVVNVIMEKGSNQLHGSLFTSVQSGSMNGSPVAYSRYDPADSGTTETWGKTDPAYQNYQPVRPHTGDTFPGFTLGGPVANLFSTRLNDRIFAFVSYNPDFNAFERTLNYGTVAEGGGLGILSYSRNVHTEYTYARVDAEVTKKIRVFGSWLYQDQRENGESLPDPDSVQGYENVATGCSTVGGVRTCSGSYEPLSNFAHSQGFTAPNMTVNTGADITLSNSLVSTTRFGYYFENYHDFGYPTTGVVTEWETSGINATDTNGNCLGHDCVDNSSYTGSPDAALALDHDTGYDSDALDQNFTHFNANKAIQFDEDIAWYHAGWGGTHNVKFGYQMHRNSNYIFQGYNEPDIQLYPGAENGAYTVSDSTVGGVNCTDLEAITNYTDPNTHLPVCTGTYGTFNVNDYGTSGRAVGMNHAFYAQDAWTIGKGLTVNFGVRFEHETLPAENQPSTQTINTPIDFGWGSKIAPRVGAAWDVFQNGKMKIFGGYGEFYDQMKLNLAISSYGGQHWQECWFGLMQNSMAGIVPAYDSNSRYCGNSTTPETLGSDAQVNWAGGTAPAGAYYLESQNLRTNPTTCSTCSLTEEGTAPGLKPYAQHDSNFGVDYQIKPTLAFEARWDRRRLDHVIEDASIYSPGNGGETFVIINPGQGIDKTFNSYFNFLYGVPPDCTDYTCPAVQNTIPAARSYDAVEFRLTKAEANHWMGMFSYTWSNFRGNYTGLTSSDIADGGGGRNAPDNSRAFDEPFFSFNANGGSSSGLLPTDRPNALKGYVYYDMPWLKRFTTDFGIFQSAYSGTPQTSEIDVGYAFAGQVGFPTDIVNRGKWIDVAQDPTTGVITTSKPYTKRTPWYLNTDFNIKQSVKLGGERALSVDATFSNVFNQHRVTAYNQSIDSYYTSKNYIRPGGLNIAGVDLTPNGSLPFYAAAMAPYDYTALMNVDGGGTVSGKPITISSLYGQPYYYQAPRNIRLAIHFTF